MYFDFFSSYNQREAWINSNFDYPVSVHGLVEVPPMVGNEKVYVALVLESMEEMESFSNDINGSKSEMFVQMLCMKIMMQIGEQDSRLKGCGLDVSLVSKRHSFSTVSENLYFDC